MNFYKALKTVLVAKKEWRLPKKSDVLVYDYNGSDILRQYISREKSTIFYIRGEFVNIPVLLMSRFRVELYVDIYIKLSRPKFIVTFTDNNISFYLLKEKHPKVIFISIQNGVRSKRGDMFSAIQDCRDKLSTDYIVTFNKIIGREYSKYISGKVEPIGSLRSNFYPIKNTQSNKDILFISQYTQPPHKGCNAHFQFINGVSVSWSSVYKAEEKVLEFLSQYCNEYGLKLSIVGRLDRPESEYKFYKEILLDSDNWEFIPNGGKENSYNLVDQSQCVVGVDSTLLYESFARGKRTAFFSWRGEILGENSCKFAWPSVIENSGPFWSNHVNKEEFYRVISYIINTNQNEWREVCLQYNQSIMDYDHENKKLISLFNKLGLPIGKRYVQQ